MPATTCSRHTPYNRIPFQGRRFPVKSCGNRAGKMTASFSASFAASNPATSSHFTLGFSVTTAAVYHHCPETHNVNTRLLPNNTRTLLSLDCYARTYKSMHCAISLFLRPSRHRYPSRLCAYHIIVPKTRSIPLREKHRTSNSLVHVHGRCYGFWRRLLLEHSS